MSIFLADEQATISFGQTLAKYCQAEFPPSGLNVYLHGELGAGKTTLVRGLVQYFLPKAKVKSPTYTLVEAYELESYDLESCESESIQANSAESDQNIKRIFHFDLYRLGDPEELEYLGGRDYFAADALCLVEWPARGDGWIAQPDLEITLKYQADGREVELKGHSESGLQLARKLLSESKN